MQEANWRSTEEQRPMCEMERVMDVDLFLGAQDQWAEDSPHCLTILHEMFLHAASKGQKEAEQVICQGHWQHMPQLNPEAGISTVQLVRLETSREELLDIYLEVYKLHRLSGSPPENQPSWKRCLPLSPGHLIGKRRDSQHPNAAWAQRFPPVPNEKTSPKKGNFSG